MNCTNCNICLMPRAIPTAPSQAAAMPQDLAEQHDIVGAAKPGVVVLAVVIGRLIKKPTKATKLFGSMITWPTCSITRSKSAQSKSGVQMPAKR